MKNDKNVCPKLKITDVKSIDKPSYLKFFSIDYLDKKGEKWIWELSSRADEKRLRDEIFEGKSYSDGAMIFATDKDKKTVVLLREFRILAGRYVYVLPAGLKEYGETVEKAAVREFKEETGLNLQVELIQKERYISVGMSNEKANTVFGYYSGVPSNEFQAVNEDAEIVIVDRKMAKDILKNEEVAVRTAMLLEHFFKLNSFLL